MEIKKNKLRDKIKEVEFSLKEFYMFKREAKIKNPQCKVNAKDLHDIIHLSARRALRHALITFFGMLFFQIPFIVKEIFERRLDFLFVSIAFIFFIYLVVYVSGKLKNIPVCAQYKLIKLAIKLSLIVKL